MKKIYEKCRKWRDMSRKKKVMCIIAGVIFCILKVIALYDLFKKQKDIEITNKVLWLLFIILIPPAPILYFIVTRIKSAQIEN